MFSFLKPRKVDAEGIVGNAVMGDISGTVIQNFHQGAPPSPPSLVWTPLPKGEDVFRLVQWRTAWRRWLAGIATWASFSPGSGPSIRVFRAFASSLAQAVPARAVHAVLDEEPTLELRAERIVQALVRREKLRVDNVSRMCGLGDHGGTRLMALAAVPGGLGATSVERLADPRLELGLPPPQQVVDLVSAFPWWRDGQIPAPSADIVAAALLLAVLAERPDMAPEWLWAAIGDSADQDLVARLDRLAYDLMSVHGPGEQRLGTWLAAIVARERTRAKSLEFLAWTEGVEHGT